MWSMLERACPSDCRRIYIIIVLGNKYIGTVLIILAGHIIIMEAKRFIKLRVCHQVSVALCHLRYLNGKEGISYIKKK